MYGENVEKNGKFVGSRGRIWGMVVRRMDREKFRSFSFFFFFEGSRWTRRNGSSPSVCPVNNLETSDAFPLLFPASQGRDFARRRCIVRWSGREFVAPCTPTAPNFQADACIIPWLEKLVL